MKMNLCVFVRRMTKKLLASTIREVIKEWEDELISTTLRVARRERGNSRDSTASSAQSVDCTYPNSLVEEIV
jgi:hypothetical protein